MAMDAVKADAVDFLTKPLEAEALLPPVANALAMDRSQRTDAAARSALENRLISIRPC